MEWILVIIIMQAYPTSIETIYKGGFTSAEECLDERGILINRFRVKGAQAVCLSVDIKV